MLAPAPAAAPVDIAEGSLEVRSYRFSGDLTGLPEAQMKTILPVNAAREGALSSAPGVLPAGAPIERERVEEAVYRVSDYLGMPARAVLVPAARLGEYDVVFEIEQGQRPLSTA